MIIVMGASGHTGRRITELLLDSGEEGRALGRSAEKLEPPRSRGAEIRTGDAEDERFLASAFQGSDAVFTLLPPDLRSADYGHSRIGWGRRSRARSTKAASGTSSS